MDKKSKKEVTKDTAVDEEIVTKTEMEKPTHNAESARDKDMDSAIDAIERNESVVATETGETEVAVADAELKPAESLKVTTDKPRMSRKSKLLVALGVVVTLIAIVIAVPFMRYGVVGVFVKKPVSLSVVDATSGRPVSGVKVTLNRTDATTDQRGIATFSNVPVGEYFVTYEKKNYNNEKASVLVPILKEYKADAQKLKSTGRTLELRFVDGISGAAIKGVQANTEGSTTTVDDSGIASMVFAPSPVMQPLTVKASGYNDQSTTVDTGIDGQQTIKLTPSGRVYFLSKRTGVISVMSAQLDGSDVREVVKGTGKETDETSLLSSPDWRYAMLISRRDGDRLKLYSIDLSDGKMKVADDRDAYFIPIGWVGGKFYYQSNSNGINSWTDKSSGIMNYTASTGERRTVDETVGMGTSYYDYASETIFGTSIIGDKVVYAKQWNYGDGYSGDRNRPVSIMTVAADTGTRAIVKQLTIAGPYYSQSALKTPGQLLFGFTHANNSIEAYQYKADSLSKTTATQGDFDMPRQFSYIMSPDGNKVLWTEPRDGKNVIFVANRDMSNQRELSRDTYLPYGWVGNDYILYSKDQSQLYITSVHGPLDGALRVTNYHKPMMYPGYGYGYGAQ